MSRSRPIFEQSSYALWERGRRANKRRPDRCRQDHPCCALLYRLADGGRISETKFVHCLLDSSFGEGALDVSLSVLGPPIQSTREMNILLSMWRWCDPAEEPQISCLKSSQHCWPPQDEKTARSSTIPQKSRGRTWQLHDPLVISTHMRAHPPLTVS